MTITSTQNRVSYAGNGAPGVPGTLVFAVPFRFLATSDLVVLVRVDATGVSTTMGLDTHYSVSGEGAATGGTVTFLIEDGEPQTGETLIIYGNPAMTQLVDYISGGVFPAESHEEALDRVTLQGTRTREIAERALSLTEVSTDGSGEYDANSNRISSLGTPTATTDATTKTYVDVLVNNTALGPAPTGLIATGSVTSRLLADRWGEVKNVKDYGAVGDGVTDDAAAIQAALDAWDTASDDEHLVFPPGRYLCNTGLTCVFTTNEAYNKSISGYGATLVSGVTSGDFWTFEAQAVVRNITVDGLHIVGGAGESSLIRLDGGDGGESQFFYSANFNDIHLQGFSNHGWHVHNSSFESNWFGCSARSGTTLGHCMFFERGDHSGLSSINLFGCITSGGLKGVYVKSPVSDVQIVGGTFILAKEQGIFIENGQGTVISHVHVENNWEGAADIGSGGAGCQINGFGSVIGLKATTNSKQRFGLKLYVSANQVSTVIGGVSLGDTEQFLNIDGASGSTAGTVNLFSNQTVFFTQNAVRLNRFAHAGMQLGADVVFTDATCDTVNTDATVTMDSTSAIRAGMAVTGSGVLASTTVASVTDATHFELSAAATATATNVKLSFSATNKQGKWSAKSDLADFEQIMHRWTGVGNKFYAYRLVPATATTLDLQASPSNDVGSESWATVYTVETSGAIGFTSPTPIADSTNDLGTSAKRWRSIFTDSIVSTISTLADEATPSVANGSFFVTSGTANDPITDFDDGVLGQTITILSEHAITITDGTHIILHGSANFVMAAADSLTLVLKADNKWYETARMVN